MAMIYEKQAVPNRQLSPEDLRAIYRTMLRIRRFEEQTAKLFAAGEVKGTAHSYVGQEAIASAVCANLRIDDYVGSYHRGHGHCIAKGASLHKMMAELMGRSTGYCGGLGGSMHIASLELGILGANGIVGAAMPLCTGAALAAKLRGSEQVAVAFFGDGAANQGVFHESLNLASVWKLPVVFVCENNHYALTTSYRSTTSVERIADRAQAYSMPGHRIDGNDVSEIHDTMRDAVSRARGGLGPSLIEALTYRWGQHSMRANLRDPRPQQELEEWKARDPIVLAANELRGREIEDQVGLDLIEAEVEAEIQSATSFARKSPEPQIEFMLSSVYSPHRNEAEPLLESERVLSFPHAVAEALYQEMERDDSVFVMGEDIGATGGIFQATKGLLDRFGEERVRDTPISEASFVGCGVGAAIAGMRPVVELQIFDFVALTMDMLVNQAAKFRYMLGGAPKVPLVIRGPQGGGIRLAAQHSQSLEAWFTHVPGLVVVAPSSPADAKGLLVSAIRDDNPVIFLESKLLYLSPPSAVPESLYAIPLGKGIVRREGTDVTLVATMAMVPRSLAAAEELASQGISVEVIDPRTLRPLDEELILNSVRKTNKLVVVHEAWTQGGFGSDVSSLVMEKAFDWLDAPVIRVGAPPVPMPYNDELERFVIPSQKRIADAMREAVRGTVGAVPSKER
jgi:2-oxoisovalerate dehydrogenase E1 component